MNEDVEAEDTSGTSVRQLLHWATGDREAEAKALADASLGGVSVEEAATAVKEAHGDLGSDRHHDDSDVATVDDAQAIHDR
jgi:hypothetical protein